MKKNTAQRPLNRDLSPLTEKEILDIVHKVDVINEAEPTMTDAEFLVDLYGIVDVLGGESILPTAKVVSVMHLRAKREGYPFKYTRAAIVNRNSSGSLFALTREELLKNNMELPKRPLMFSLRDILSIPLGRWPAGYKRKHKTLRFNRPGRPTKAMQEEMERMQEQFRKGQLAVGF